MQKKRKILVSHVEVTNFKKLSFWWWLSLETTRTHDSGIRECCLDLSSSPLCRNICHLSVTKVAFDLRSDFFFSALSCFCSSLNDLEGAFVLFEKPVRTFTSCDSPIFYVTKRHFINQHGLNKQRRKLMKTKTQSHHWFLYAWSNAPCNFWKRSCFIGYNHVRLNSRHSNPSSASFLFSSKVPSIQKDIGSSFSNCFSILRNMQGVWMMTS